MNTIETIAIIYFIVSYTTWALFGPSTIFSSKGWFHVLVFPYKALGVGAQWNFFSPEPIDRTTKMYYEVFLRINEHLVLPSQEKTPIEEIDRNGFRDQLFRENISRFDRSIYYKFYFRWLLDSQSIDIAYVEKVILTVETCTLNGQNKHLKTKEHVIFFD